ncbi:unnamed protein product [Macrosiphum euphorbiae]|uniref:Inhibitor of growth protein 3 n=1 Tax=Macrosiphum euphorbiae TaxID=13131 RepID=A0AAV0W8B2_9HEMI|nr:unnamed protein product [Macrosiphum euphorbiae]
MNDILNNAVDCFLDNYDDVLKNFPLDGQKQVSRYYETDCRHSHILKKLENFTKKAKDFTSTDGERMKKMLIESLDLADRKVNITECLLDMVGTNMLNLNMSYKEVETAKQRLTSSNKRMSKLMPKEIDSDSIDVQNINNSNKRPKRNVTKLSTTLNKSVEMKAHFDRKSSTNQNKKKTTSTKKSKAQPAKNKKIDSGSESSDSDGDDLQPTYCICEEISYGDMVGCDNDLCPLEWCHFGCVSISRKPKGKWYCPFCRGTTSKTMKPKSVFLKELEEYNKRKEENWSK